MYPDNVKGIHLNFLVARPPKDDPMKGVTSEEMTGVLHSKQFHETGTAYQKVQGSKPQALGYGLNDSPAGLAAWIIEKFHAWTDC